MILFLFFASALSQNVTANATYINGTELMNFQAFLRAVNCQNPFCKQVTALNIIGFNCPIDVLNTNLPLGCTNTTTPSTITKIIFYNESFTGTIGKEVQALTGFVLSACDFRWVFSSQHVGCVLFRWPWIGLKFLAVERTGVQGRIDSIDWSRLPLLEVLSFEANQLRGSA